MSAWPGVSFDTFTAEDQYTYTSVNKPLSAPSAAWEVRFYPNPELPPGPPTGYVWITEPPKAVVPTWAELSEAERVKRRAAFAAERERRLKNSG